MTEIVTGLDNLLVDGNFPIEFNPNPQEDPVKQAALVAACMVTKVPYKLRIEYVRGDALAETADKALQRAIIDKDGVRTDSFFPRDVFANLVRNNCSGEEQIAPLIKSLIADNYVGLTTRLCRAVSKAGRTLSRKKKRKATLGHVDDIINLIYSPTTFYDHWSEEFNEAGFRLSGKARTRLNEGTEVPSFIAETQGRLLLCLMNRHKACIDASRVFSYKMLEDEGFVAGWHKAFGSGELSAHPTSSLAVPELKFSLLTHFIGFSRKAHFGKWEALYSLVTGEKMKWAIQHGLPFDICTLSEAEKERSLDTQLGLQSTLSKYVLEKGAEITEDYDRMKAELKEVTRQSREQGKQIESLSGRTAYLKSEVRSHKESEAALREELADVHASREKTVAAAVEKHKTSRAQEFADVQRDLGRLTYVEEQARKAELECAEVTTAYEASQKRVDDLEDQVSDLEQQVALLSEDEVEPVEVAFSVKNAPEDVLSRAERLLRLKNPPGTKPIKKVKEGPQDNLSRIFSYLGERTYFKIKLPHHWRGIYVIERDKTILLMVLPHDEYDYLGHKVNYTPTKYVNGARGNA